MNTYAAIAQREDLITIAPALPSPATVRPAPPSGRLPGANLAAFWEARGFRVFEMNGVLWGQYKGGFFTSLPFHLHLDPDADEIRAILRKSSVRGLRFPSSHLPGRRAGMYVANPATFGIQSISRRQRSHVNHGLRVCEFRTVTPDELLSEGIELNRDTLQRQKRADVNFLEPARWAAFVGAVEKTPGMTVHGAYVDGRLSAYVISCREGEWMHLIYKMSRAADLEHYPNHALDFTIVKEAAEDSAIRYVGNGFTSVLENEGLDRYKRQMGYEIAEHNLCLHFHPALAPGLSSKVAVWLASGVQKVLPGNDRVEYIATVIRGAHDSRPKKKAEISASEDSCQQEEALGFSRLLRPAAAFPILRTFQMLRKGGVKATVLRGADYVGRKLLGRGKKSCAGVRPLGPDEVLRLDPGDLVEVKSLEEIRATLDERGKNRGLLFTDDMKGYVGRQFRVFKRVESIFLEESKQRRTLKNTVLLEAVYCPGITFRCDRSCFLFWKEVWLRRATTLEKK
jgi:hypothetical protein